MHFSPSFKTSQRCLPSPNGSLIASLAFSSPTSATVTIRTTSALQTTSSIKVTQEASSPVSGLAWSPSSTRALVSTTDQIRVYNVDDASLHTVIRNPGSGGGKPTHIQFGATDDEIIVVSAFGLKLACFDLTTSKAVEIANPKFHHAVSATRGFAFSPLSGHMAALTRSGGRDALSIHQPKSRELKRSWIPETIDAAGLVWTPDGQWLLLRESPAHGHRLLLYTPDGQLFRALDASRLCDNAEATLQPGLRLCQTSTDGRRCVIGDHSRTVTVLDTVLWRVEVRLNHPLSAAPKDTLQIWQEQIGKSADGHQSHDFVRATQTVSPEGATSNAKSAADLRVGCSSAAFDASSELLATQLDESPCTLWIWDVASAELRAVLMFHSSVTFSWHPSIRELLLINCQDEAFRGLSYVWDPLSDGPRYLSLKEQLPEGKIQGKTQALWVKWPQESPVVFLSDANHYLLAVVSDSLSYPERWPLNEHGGSRQGSLSRGDIPLLDDLDEDDHSTLEDTFSFKHG